MAPVQPIHMVPAHALLFGGLALVAALVLVRSILQVVRETNKAKGWVGLALSLPIVAITMWVGPRVVVEEEKPTPMPPMPVFKK